jgi:hypothetical protein
VTQFTKEIGLKRKKKNSSLFSFENFAKKTLIEVNWGLCRVGRGPLLFLAVFFGIVKILEIRYSTVGKPMGRASFIALSRIIL